MISFPGAKVHPTNATLITARIARDLSRWAVGVGLDRDCLHVDDCDPRIMTGAIVDTSSAPGNGLGCTCGYATVVLDRNPADEGAEIVSLKTKPIS